jgi:hypothetical protein
MMSHRESAAGVIYSISHIMIQMLSAAPLVEKFRTNSFEESDIGPYIIATLVFQTVMIALPGGPTTWWGITSSISMIIVTIFGMFYLKKKNGNSFGDGFILKFFSLGWVITVRIFLLAIPIGMILFGFIFALRDYHLIEPFGAMIGIALAVWQIVWLGRLIAATREHMNVRPPTN